MTRKLLIVLIALFTVFSTIAQEEYLDAKAEDDLKIYPGGESYNVQMFPQNFKKKKPKNVVLFIVDGMGLSHLHAALTANKGSLYLENLRHIGLSKTASADRYEMCIRDSLRTSCHKIIIF